jgi:glycosyltransferase involved in cell wall biosynthesis
VDALLVPARDSDAMAQALLRLPEEPALALRLRQAGIATARRYAWPAVRPLLFAAYADAMASAARGRAFGVRKAS